VRLLQDLDADAMPIDQLAAEPGTDA